MTCHTRFCMNRLETCPWRQKKKKSPSMIQTFPKWQYPFTWTQMESYSKNDFVVESPCLQASSWTLCTKYFFLKRTMIISSLTEDLQDMVVFQVLPFKGRGSIPASLEIAENKQNIVTGHLKHERTLKSSKATTARDSAFGHLDFGYCLNTNPLRVEAGGGKWVSRGPKWLP